MRTLRSVAAWFMPVVPEARVAILRTVLYLFVIIDIHLFVRDPIPLSRHPELYQPLMIERLFQLPPPSVPLTITLYLILIVGCLVAAANVLPRLAGVVVAAAFTWWTAIGMSYGKVDHDHLALVVALWVLPTVGVIADRWRSVERSAQAGWALKCIQISVVFTYFLSALTKIRSGGWSITSWPDSSILMWAIIRRPHGLGQFLLPYPELLHVMQWFSFTAELTAVVVLLLRGRALLAGCGVLDGVPRIHCGDLVHPLRANCDLLARLCAVRATWSLAAPGQSRAEGARKPEIRPASGAGSSRSRGRRRRLVCEQPAGPSHGRQPRTRRRGI